MISWIARIRQTSMALLVVVGCVFTSPAVFPLMAAVEMSGEIDRSFETEQDFEEAIHTRARGPRFRHTGFRLPRLVPVRRLTGSDTVNRNPVSPRLNSGSPNLSSRPLIPLRI